MSLLAKGALAILGVAGIAGATTVTCPAPNPGAPMNVAGLAAYCGGITFSNFQVTPSGSGKTALVYPLGAGAFAEVDRSALDEAGREAKRTACNVLDGQHSDLCPDSALLASLLTASGTMSNKAGQSAPPAASVGRVLDNPPGGASGIPESFQSVPEPAAFLLAGPALLGLLALRRKK
jgi:hypothetical protein